MTYYTIGQSGRYLERGDKQKHHSCANSFYCLFKSTRQSWRVEPKLSECFKWNNDEIIKEVFKVISNTKYREQLLTSVSANSFDNFCQYIESRLMSYD